jgi:hypothetical protein
VWVGGRVRAACCPGSARMGCDAGPMPPPCAWRRQGQRH